MQMHWGSHLDLAVRASVPVQRGARFRSINRALMQRGARFSVFSVPSGGSPWVQSGGQKRYETNAFWMFFKKKAVP